MTFSVYFMIIIITNHFTKTNSSGEIHITVIHIYTKMLKVTKYLPAIFTKYLPAISVFTYLYPLTILRITAAMSKILTKFRLYVFQLLARSLEEFICDYSVSLLFTMFFVLTILMSLWLERVFMILNIYSWLFSNWLFESSIPKCFIDQPRKYAFLMNFFRWFSLMRLATTRFSSRLSEFPKPESIHLIVL